MKAHLTDNIYNFKTFLVLFISSIIIIFCSACTRQESSKLLVLSSDDYSAYSKVVKETLPTFIIEKSNNRPYYNLDNGSVVEAFNTQASGALETGVANFWSPHYLATPIIAIDRDKIDASISTWSDLLLVENEVGLVNIDGSLEMLLAAIGYGLEGEDYTLKGAIQLLASLNDNQRLKINSTDSPIIICFDYQAVSLKEKGRRLEIIIPKEGTLVYEKGLLSKEKLEFKGDINDLLFRSNLRLLSGEANTNLYPNEKAYKSAVKVSDYKDFAKTTQKSAPLFERKVLKARKYMSIDNFEHILFALLYIIIISLWAVSIIRRSMQKGVSLAAFFTGLILLGWSFVRLVKYQVELNPVFARYLWYSFYIFQLTLPLVLLWMAWAIDKPIAKFKPPPWLRKLAFISGLLIIAVFTNDLHGLVLKIDLTRLDWDINYGYGFIYYIILSFSMINLLLVFLILIKKSMKNPDKKGVFLPFIIFIMFGLYNYKYIRRDPFAYQTDLTIITGLFTMLMFETCIRTGLIPANTKYVRLFKKSPLKMQIIDKEGKLMIQSASAIPLEEKIIDKILKKSPLSIMQEDNMLLFANPIPGGHTIWHEDLSKIYQLHAEIQKSTQMLIEANAILLEEKKLKRIVKEADAKKHLMEQLEAEIATSLAQLTKMIEKLASSEEESKEATRIALLLCYIKRRCNLFFKEKEEDYTSTEELIVWIDELAEIGKYSDVELAKVNEFKGSIDIRYSRLFYDLFYMVMDKGIQTDCSYIIGYFESNNNIFTMKLLPSQNIGKLQAEKEIRAAISAEQGQLLRKKTEETVGINVSFPKGGEAYD